MLLYPGPCGLLRLEQVGYGARDPDLQPNLHPLHRTLSQPPPPHTRSPGPQFSRSSPLPARTAYMDDHALLL